MTGAAWARRLASGAPIGERVAIVVAHPDDETLWTGSLLPRLRDGLLIHVTDGAPRDMEDAAALGFVDRDAYREAREAEIVEALERLGADVEHRRYLVPDKEAALALPALADRLAGDLRGAAVVITHPYEGGHPDHDACAWAVARACGRLGGHAPARVEFACYHLRDGERRFGLFWPGPEEHERRFDVPERERVAAAIATHRTQAAVIGGWTPEREMWRAAPEYDFAAPPPPGRALYDGFGWEMTSERFSALAREAGAC